MKPDKRVEIFTAVVIATVVIIHFLNFPIWLLTVVKEFGISFVLSGIFYAFLLAAGLDFLEEIQIGFASVMTITVFVIKHLLI